MTAKTAAKKPNQEKGAKAETPKRTTQANVHEEAILEMRERIQNIEIQNGIPRKPWKVEL